MFESLKQGHWKETLSKYESVKYAAEPALERASVPLMKAHVRHMQGCGGVFSQHQQITGNSKSEIKLSLTVIGTFCKIWADIMGSTGEMR